ncbi:MAG TPA: NotI family restriction endonuclease [Anaerolineales bacterium]|nr:NotI family restriction endonuclease [Anaerolineales bacterium]
MSNGDEIVELFGLPATRGQRWQAVVEGQHCPYLDRKCIKVRKSEPDVSIGTCTVHYGKAPIVICPFRLLERRQVFADCIHLLTLHEPGNEFHIVTEVSIPGGSIDYFLVSVHRGRAIDFVGIELQTLDTTGTVWPARERFLQFVGVPHDREAAASGKPFGMNWKMTAKTILVQLHHKVETFAHLSKHLVLVVQDRLLDYMRREFSFDHLAREPRVGDPMHFHSYSLQRDHQGLRLEMAQRLSTDVAGIATALGLQAEAKVEIESILADIQRKLSNRTRWTP